MAEPQLVECDVLIVGGGLVGSLLANALSTLPLATVLVEARHIETLEQPSFDARVTALANSSQRVLQQLDLWSAVVDQAQAIREIHVGERGRFGAARIRADEEGVAALGYTVENRALGGALWAPLSQHESLRWFAPAEVTDCDATAEQVSARLAHDGRDIEIRARLLVAADGARSTLRAALGIDARVDDYAQCALILNCTTDEPHGARAFERFMPGGPLAVLPLTDDRVSIVWTVPATRAEALVALGDDEFRRELQTAFGYRLGRFRQIGRRDSYQLHRVQSAGVVGERTVLIGNAANALHPVAGQGFNLALRDVAALADVIAEARANGPSAIGAEACLEAYRSWRAADQRKLATFTHALIRGFGNDWPGLGIARGMALMAFDCLPGTKSLLARHTMGLAGRVPRLARHLGLAG